MTVYWHGTSISTCSCCTWETWSTTEGTSPTGCRRRRLQWNDAPANMGLWRNGERCCLISSWLRVRIPEGPPAVFRQFPLMRYKRGAPIPKGACPPAGEAGHTRRAMDGVLRPVGGAQAGGLMHGFKPRENRKRRSSSRRWKVECENGRGERCVGNV